MAQSLTPSDAIVSSAISERRRRQFELLVLLSGVCGISYEILYGRILSNFIGDQFAISASILLTFLLGMGVGALYARRLWRFLWLIEGGIGLCGAAIALGAPYLDQWLYLGAYGSGGLSQAVIVCLLVITVPAFLIGCSLALFPGYLSQLNQGHVFARAYSLYNLGAATTAVLIEFWLLRKLGIRNSLLTIAATNATVSFILLCVFRRLRNGPPITTSQANFPLSESSALAVASIASAIFQLLAIKLAECVLGPFRETFALILALILGGIALGSLITEKFRLGFGALMLIGLASLAWLMGGFGWTATTYASLRPFVVDHYFTAVLLKLALLAVLIGPAAIIFGATIPALLTRQDDVARQSGQLLFVSSVANAFGFMLMAFVLHRYFDYGTLIIIIAAMTAVAAMIHGGFDRRVFLASAALLITVFVLHRSIWSENSLYLGHTAFHSAAELNKAKANLRFAEKFKGHQDVFSLTRTRDNVQFFINGFVSISLNSPAEKIVGALPALFAPRTDRALVLGLGSGATGGTVALLFDRVDAVEINPVVIQNLFRMAEFNFAIHSRPNVNVIVDDGLHFTKVAKEKYSLVINTVTTPLYFSSAKLYTFDFFESVRRIMTADGIYVTWVDSRVGDRGLDIILKTLGQSFQQCSIAAIKSTYYLLLCSQKPIALRQPYVVRNNSILADYFAKNSFPAESLPYSLLGTRVLTLVGDAQVPLNTHDYPALEFEIARLGRRGIDGFKRRLLASMDLKEVATALQPLAFNPLQLALYTNLLLGDSAISDRWINLASRSVDGFAARYKQTKLDYYGAQAATVKTAEAYRKYGAALINAELYPESIKQLRTALAIDAKTDNAFFNLGAAYEKSGRLEAALENYANELRVDPNDDEVAYRQGRVLYKLKRFNEALVQLEAAAKRRDTANTQYYLGLTLEALGRSSDARSAYSRALGLNHQHSEARAAIVRLQNPPSSSTGG